VNTTITNEGHRIPADHRNFVFGCRRYGVKSPGSDAKFDLVETYGGICVEESHHGNAAFVVIASVYAINCDRKSNSERSV